MTKSPTAKLADVEALPVSVAILDATGTIISVNETWKHFGRRNGLRVPRYALGANYLDFCPADGSKPRRFRRDLKALIAGRLDLLTHIYPCHSPRKQRWFSLVGLPLSLERPAGIALLHVDLTNMLPATLGEGTADIIFRSKDQSRATAKLNAIGGAVQATVSHALAAQLTSMLGGSRQHPEQYKRPGGQADRTLLAHAKLSKRQMQVLRLIGEGKTNKEIANLLSRSPNTIKLHVSAILRQLDLKSRTQAALLSSRMRTGG